MPDNHLKVCGFDFDVSPQAEPGKLLGQHVCMICRTIHQNAVWCTEQEKLAQPSPLWCQEGAPQSGVWSQKLDIVRDQSLQEGDAISAGEGQNGTVGQQVKHGEAPKILEA